MTRERNPAMPLRLARAGAGKNFSTTLRPLAMAALTAYGGLAMPKSVFSDPDAELIALGREFDIAAAEEDRLHEEFEALDDRAWQLAGLTDADLPKQQTAQQKTALNSITTLLGVPDSEQRYEESRAITNALGERILKLPAHGLDGLRVKARCAYHCNGDFAAEINGSFNNEQVMYSLVLDLLAMEEPPAAPARAA